MAEIRVEQGDIVRYAGDALVVNLFEGVERPGGATGAVDAALDGAIAQLIAAGDLRGKEGEVVLIHTFGKIAAPRVVVVGLGKREKFSLDTVRDLAANVARFLRRHGYRRVATILHGTGAGGLAPEASARAIAEGTLLGLYRFTRHKAPEEDTRDLETLTLIDPDPERVAAARRGVRWGASSPRRPTSRATWPTNRATT